MLNFIDSFLGKILSKKKLFGILGASLLIASYFFSAIGQLSRNGEEFMSLFFPFLAVAILLVGIIIGLATKNNKVLLLSYVGFTGYFIVTTLTNRLVGASSYYGASGGIELAYWFFGFFFLVAFLTYFVITILTHTFGKYLETAEKVSFMATLLLGLLFWIFGICHAANTGWWEDGVTPLLTVSGLSMFPCVTSYLEGNESEEAGVTVEDTAPKSSEPVSTETTENSDTDPVKEENPTSENE